MLYHYPTTGTIKDTRSTSIYLSFIRPSHSRAHTPIHTGKANISLHQPREHEAMDYGRSSW